MINKGTPGRVLLEVVGVTKNFGYFRALNGVSFTVRQGEVRALIGPNGAGKSTLVSVISGEIRPDAGSVVFAGREITGYAPCKIARLGLVRTFQISNFFENLTVSESLRGALARGCLRAVSSPQLQEMLALVGLSAQADRVAAELSHGERRLLEIGLALAQRPKFLLLDEPTAGLSPTETVKTVELMQRLKREGHALLLIEHDLSVVRALADRLTVLHQGRAIAEGTLDEIARRVEYIYSLTIPSLPLLEKGALC
jgi:branched-chain amino acid transport system ATP-binding protein